MIYCSPSIPGPIRRKAKNSVNLCTEQCVRPTRSSLLCLCSCIHKSDGEIWQPSYLCQRTPFAIRSYAKSLWSVSLTVCLVTTLLEAVDLLTWPRGWQARDGQLQQVYILLCSMPYVSTCDLPRLYRKEYPNACGMILIYRCYGNPAPDWPRGWTERICKVKVSHPTAW